MRFFQIVPSQRDCDHQQQNAVAPPTVSDIGALATDFNALSKRKCVSARMLLKQQRKLSAAPCARVCMG
jgi:hypothetical protein